VATLFFALVPAMLCFFVLVNVESAGEDSHYEIAAESVNISCKKSSVVENRPGLFVCLCEDGKSGVEIRLEGEEPDREVSVRLSDRELVKYRLSSDLSGESQRITRFKSRINKTVLNLLRWHSYKTPK